jgi:hypothetical protein
MQIRQLYEVPSAFRFAAIMHVTLSYDFLAPNRQHQ